MLEANPGPGAGLLIAYSIFGTGVARNTAPAALIIQFFGGIHEIYFPFVLLKPLTILATIAGAWWDLDPGHLRAGAAGPGGAQVDHRGVRPDPREQSGRGDLVGPVGRGDVVSGGVGDPAASRRRDEAEGDLAAATAQMEGIKGKESSISGVLNQLEAEEAQARTSGRADPQDRVRL